MTIAVIVACENGFYIITDTLTRSDTEFSLNTQKAFFSHKHRIGMCIAGEANLKFPEITDVKDVLYTNYVISEFFKYIDSLEGVLVENLENMLTAFLHAHYGQYYNSFVNGVSYFYGGFKLQGGNETTTIYSSHSGNKAEYSYLPEDQEPNCFFANTDAVQLSLASIVSLENRRNIWIDPTKRNVVFTVVALASLTLNGKHPFSIGDLLHYVFLPKKGGCIEEAVRYESDLPYPKVINDQPMPQYLIYRSFQESNVAFLNGELVKYHLPTQMDRTMGLYPVADIQALARENLFFRAQLQGGIPAVAPQGPQQMFAPPPPQKIVGPKMPPSVPPPQPNISGGKQPFKKM